MNCETWVGQGVSESEVRSQTEKVFALILSIRENDNSISQLI